MNNHSDIRPPLLSALCVLTFAGSGIAFPGYFMASVFFEKFGELIVKYSSWHSLEKISPLYFTILMVLYAISLSGAVRMWKLHRDGYLLYTISQLGILFIPVLWIDWYAFSVTNAIFTAVFIIGYGINRRSLH
ncbi:MAG: hypothetical protein PHN68_06380 [Prolixibacteraceae bacterium]|jgi:hypothetical protein|nr:hypothetical protein [Prolixibacteraceae bacterium]MDD4755656.1 hypothetical protein [Prolixibacteraceae bacterium]NLO00846.1 hypothetical protein [Bacteroidales bacterium]